MFEIVQLFLICDTQNKISAHSKEVIFKFDDNIPAVIVAYALRLTNITISICGDGLKLFDLIYKNKKIWRSIYFPL